MLARSSNVDEEVPSAVTAKAVAMAVLFTASMTLGTLPIQLSRWFKWSSSAQDNVVVKLLLCFGGGVLLCTTFLHMLPEVAENIEDLGDKLPTLPLPLAELLMCIGFFLMYGVEELVHTYIRRREAKREVSRRNTIVQISAPAPVHFNSKMDLLPDGLEIPSYDSMHSHKHGHIMVDKSSAATIRGLLVVLALSVHELFEGLAVGLEQSAATVWYMFGAVAAHKLVIAFCIGVELVTMGTSIPLVILYVFIFAVVSPMGIGIGITVSAEAADDVTAVPSVLLQGLASGTLLYVVFFEILSSSRRTGLKEYLAIVLGFVIMAGLTTLDAD